MSPAGRFGDFDLRVRGSLLVAVVLFGGVAIASTVLLGEARRALESACREAAVGASGEVVANLEERLPAEPSPTFLRQLAMRGGFESVRVISEGDVLRETGTDAPSQDEAAALRAGRVVVLRRTPDAAVAPNGFRVLHPVVAPSGKVERIVEGLREAGDLARIERWWRWVVAAHIAGIMALAVAGLAFADWVGRPYRKIAAAAGEAGLGLSDAGKPADPEDLAGAVRAVVAKLRDQEAALGAVEREGGGLGDLVRFASRAATAMTAGVLVVDRRARVAAINPAAADLLGIAGQDVRDRPAAEVAAGIPGLCALVARCLEHGVSASREVVEARYPDGRTGHLGVSVSPCPSADGQIAGGVVLMTDLTEIRELQEHARARDNLATVGSVAAGIAHEFRNALGTILANARLLERRDDLVVRGPALSIVREVDALGKVIDEFLLYARPPSAAAGEFELRRPVVRAAAAAPETIEVAVLGSFGRVLADETLVARVFENLLRNAADAASDAGRKLHVRIEGRPAAGERVVQVEVEDDGPGIPAEQLGAVFAPFFTTRARGTGLGLAFVHRTMSELGGSIEAARGAGGGALFRLRFPLAAAKLAVREAVRGV